MQDKSNDNELNNLDGELDWEYMSDFFVPNPDLNKEDNKLKTLEEYAAECSNEITGEKYKKECSPELAEIIEAVTAVKAESAAGLTVKEIAVKLNLSEQYITTILFTVQGYAEDDDFAIAQLVQLG